jgi:hypothetical protein
MATLQTRLQDLATRVATECKALRTLTNGNLADLSSLTTTAKGNLVAAINELQAEINAISTGAQINDGSTGATVTWSAQKIGVEIQNAKNALTNGAAAALDTLAEIATALGNDANFAATVTTALGNRIRFDAVQALSAAQITQACANLGLGEPDTNFVATFTAGLA